MSLPLQLESILMSLCFSYFFLFFLFLKRKIIGLCYKICRGMHKKVFCATVVFKMCCVLRTSTFALAHFSNKLIQNIQIFILPSQSQK